MQTRQNIQRLESAKTQTTFLAGEMGNLLQVHENVSQPAENARQHKKAISDGKRKQALCTENRVQL